MKPFLIFKFENFWAVAPRTTATAKFYLSRCYPTLKRQTDIISSKFYRALRGSFYVSRGPIFVVGNIMNKSTLRYSCLVLSDPHSKRIEENKMTGGCALLYKGTRGKQNVVEYFLFDFVCRGVSVTRPARGSQF